MYKSPLLSFVIAVLAGAALCQAQDVPELPKPTKEHEWLQQLTGEWESEAQMFMQPGEPPVTSTGIERVRSIGGFWIMAENTGEFGGHPYTGLMTLGYDTQTEKYVGTWIDSMSGYLWKYEGTVNEAGNALTLESEGPCPASGGELTRFKEVVEIKSPDHKVFTSSMQDKDGKWTTTVTINYRRTK